MCHGGAATLLQRQAGLGTIQRLNLAFFVNAQHNGMFRRIQIPLVMGMDPFQVENISQRLIRDVYTEGAQIHMCAVAAIEIALWDIIGKACNQPIYNLWGGQCHEKLRAYANGWYRGPRTPESFAAKAKLVAARGYTALKFDPFGSSWRFL